MKVLSACLHSQIRIQFANSIPVISEQQNFITVERKCPNKCSKKGMKTTGKIFSRSVLHCNSEKLDLISMNTE